MTNEQIGILRNMIAKFDTHDGSVWMSSTSGPHIPLLAGYADRGWMALEPLPEELQLPSWVVGYRMTATGKVEIGKLLETMPKGDEMVTLTEEMVDKIRAKMKS